MQKLAPGEFRRGWPVLLSALVGTGVGVVSLPYYTSGLFVRPLQESFGWSRTEIAGALTCGSLVLTASGPLVGKLVDSVGVRPVALVSLLLLALGFVVMTQVGPSPASFIAAFGLLTLLGAGTSPVTFTRAVTGWFDRRRGLALGIVLVGPGIAGAIAPPLLSRLIDAQGWQAGYLALAAAAAVSLPLIAFARDGRSGTATRTAPAGMGFGAALRSAVLWKLALAALFAASAIVALLAHFVPLLIDGGVPAQRAASYASVIGISVVVSRIVVGFLLDRLFAPAVAAVVFVAAASAFLLLAVGGVGAALPAAAILGVALGVEGDVIAYLTSRYFGLRAYGRIFGLVYGAFLVGGALSPLAAGWVFDRLGSYQPALYGGAVLLLAAAALVGTLGRYRSFTL
ncbi:MAG: transporter [Rhodospirillales bacterium]|nr:transporter [Rhodospirillales bacterium]